MINFNFTSSLTFRDTRLVIRRLAANFHKVDERCSTTDTPQTLASPGQHAHHASSTKDQPHQSAVGGRGKVDRVEEDRGMWHWHTTFRYPWKSL